MCIWCHVTYMYMYTKDEERMHVEGGVGRITFTQ